jgi:hypothetical protein
MAKDVAEPEAEVLETPEIDETEDQVAEPESEEAESPEPEEGDEEETIIGFGDEDEPEAEAETPTIKRIRERNRDLNKQLRERDRELEELRRSNAPAKIEVGPEPTLESCDWDEDKFKSQLLEWRDKKAEADNQVAAEQQKTQRVLESYNRDLTAYNERKATIGVPDYEEAEATVVAALNMEQQAVAVQAAKDPAALVVALSRSPEKLAELAKIDNPWKLAAAIARMESSVKVVTRKKGPNLDRPVRGSASMVAVDTDKELERLEKEAERTGNRTAVVNYKRQLKAQAK